MKKQEINRLVAWIEEIGVEKVAVLLDVTPSTVRHWRLARCYPKVRQMRAIKKLSKGVVDYHHIIERPLIGEAAL